MWVKKHKPDIWAGTEKIMFAKDYVRHRLTGDYVTDRIEAEGSMFFDYTTGDWSPELCALLDFPPEKLPRLVDPGDIVGKVTREASLDTGLTEGTPVLCGTTDTVMEVFAAGAVGKGQMTLKLATAGLHLRCDRPSVPRPRPHQLLAYSEGNVVSRHGDEGVRVLAQMVPRHVRRRLPLDRYGGGEDTDRL